MKFLPPLLLGLLPCLGAFGQKLSCSCEALLDTEYKSALQILAKPNGRVLRSVKHDFRAEDYLVLTIDQEAGDFFHGKVAYAISGRAYQGWVRKSARLGLYTRNYGPAPLALYRQPAATAGKIRVPAAATGFYSLRHCAGKWAYVQVAYKKHPYEGWLPPNRQCANHYTTCN